LKLRDGLPNLKGHPTDPLMIEVNTSTEYWQKGASLVHTDPAGRHDAEVPATARVYMIAGTQHGGRPPAYERAIYGPVGTACRAESGSLCARW
jgi:hypothetical protein